jgi:hypothetical protein
VERPCLSKQDGQISELRLDRFHVLILDDLAYVSKDQPENSGANRAYRQLRAQVHARRRQPAVRRMGQGSP